MKPLVFLLTLLFAYPCFGTVLFSDDFNQVSDWSGITDDVSLITSEETGQWDGIWCNTQSTDNYGSINDSFRYGASGKGFQFKMTANTCGAPASAQESCMFSNGASVSETTLFWGYRFKLNQTTWGTSSANKTLKLTRFYAGETSIIPGIVGDDHNLSVFPLDGGAYLDTGYDISDTSWHTYIFQFTAGDSNDGIVRLWVDGTLEYENTAVDYPGTSFHYDYFPMIQGNLSGGYNGDVLLTWWDDYVWATTKAEIESFMGSAALPDPPGPGSITSGGHSTISTGGHSTISIGE